MKNVMLIAVWVTVSLMLIPLSALALEKNNSMSTAAMGEFKEEPPISFSDSFKLYIKESDEIVSVSAEDYVIGVVAAEMPALYEQEALKAQAVAAYTFACYRRESSDKEYDLSNDPALDQAYCTNGQLREKWGESFDTYYTKIKDAVKAVEGELLCYKGKIALSVYHAISSGRTNPSADVWGKELPYLKGVESMGDKLNRDYISAVSFTAATIAEKLGVAGSFSDIQKSSSGRVISIKYADKSYSGAEIQKLFSLRSAAFDIQQSGESFNFTVYGYGHGVGMSQSGADYMAKQGSTYREILFWYYPGCEIKKK